MVPCIVRDSGKIIVRLIPVIVMLVIMATDVMACPSCKEGFRPGSAEAVAGSAFSASVMFMLAVPMLIFTTFTVVLVRRMKKVERGEV